MSKKITGKDLRKLVESALMEDNVNLAGLKAKLFKKAQSDYDTKEPQIKSLASNDNINTSISQDDVTKAFKDEEQNEIDAARFLKDKILAKHPDRKRMVDFVANAEADATEFEAGVIQAVAPEKIRSIAFKSMQNLSSDPTDATAMGQFPEGIATALNVVFQEKNTFKERIEHIGTVCKEARDGLTGSSQLTNPADIAGHISKLLVLDYITTLAREVDSGSGAYRFEEFLAMLVGGRVTGKEMTPDGKMGGADFRAPDGSAGSSKYYSTLSNISQSSKGFKENEPVFYVICLKEKDEVVISDPVNESKKNQSIIKFKIYTFFINNIANINKKSYFAWKYANGELFVDEIKEGARIKFDSSRLRANTPNPIEIELVTADQKDIRSQVTSVIKNRTDTHAQALKHVEKIGRNLYSANEKSQAYSSTANISKADEALAAIVEANSGIRDLAKILNPNQTLTNESKKVTPNLLKKLIEENFKK